MSHVDELAPHFRLSLERWPEAPNLSNHYAAVDEAFGGTTHGMIATVKSFVDCVCLTVLGEFGQPQPGSAPSTTALLGEALRCLGLQNNQGGSKVSKLLSAHNKFAEALSDIRNNGDPIAHGKDGFLDLLSSNEKRAYVLTADTILALLLAAHNGTDPDLQYTRYPYERFEHLHARVDRSVGIDVTVSDDDGRQTIVVDLRTASLPEGIRLRCAPSQFLYALDRSAYVEILRSASAGIDELDNDVEIEVVQEAPRDILSARAVPPIPLVVAKYHGRLQHLRPDLLALLDALHFDLRRVDRRGIVESLLATVDEHLGLDWASREPLIAAMQIALRRLLVRLSVEREEADRVADELVMWLQTQPEEPQAP